mgnify:FL=1
MEPVTTALAGIALVKKSVDFIKSNIQTCQDIGQLIGHVENAMIGEQQIIRDRDKRGADPFATENVAQEIIDAKIAREHLNELKNLINLRFGPNTWQEILTERKRRIDQAKERKRKAIAEKNRKMREIQEIFTYFTIGLGVIVIVCLLGYTFFVIL